MQNITSGISRPRWQRYCMLGRTWVNEPVGPYAKYTFIPALRNLQQKHLSCRYTQPRTLIFYYKLQLPVPSRPTTSPMLAETAATIQNRIVTFVSGHPSASK